MTTSGAVGRYQVLGLLGEGGHAAVYRAWDAAQGREVAMKVLLPHVAPDPELRRRFAEEAAALAHLRHRNIVAVLEIDDDPRWPFFTMELVEGESVAQLLARDGAMPPLRVAQIMQALCSAVEYLHWAGIVHRDIKAANVMVDGSGRLVLMDFGIARAVDTASRTVTGSYLGTPEAMSPEQIQGHPAAPAADIYALGVLAYTMLAGVPPFTGDAARVLHGHLDEPPPPLAAVRPDLSPAVVATVHAALAKDPGLRPPSASAFAAMLQGSAPPPSRVEQTQPIPPTPAPVPSGGWGPSGGVPVAAVAGGESRGRVGILVAAMVVVALLVVGGAFALLRGGGDEASVTPPPALASITDLKVIDNVFSGKSGAFEAGPSVAACFGVALPPEPRTLQVLVTSKQAQPKGAADAAIVARSTPITAASGPGCHEVSVVVGSLAPAPYWLWVMDGERVVGSSQFRVLAPSAAGNASTGDIATPPPTTPPTRPPATVAPPIVTAPPVATAQPTPSAPPTPTPPTPSPTPVATAAPRFRQDQLVRVNTPNSCLRQRVTPSLTADGVDCRPDGEHVQIIGGPQRIGTETWWRVRSWDSGAEGWSREGDAGGAFLVAAPECDSDRAPRSCAANAPRPPRCAERGRGVGVHRLRARRCGRGPAV